MDRSEGPSGRGEEWAPRPEFGPLPQDTLPQVRTYVEALRVIFAACELSVRRFAGLHHYDAGTVSRYLNGRRIPPRIFLDTVLEVAAKKRGVAVKVEVQHRLYDLHMDALAATNPSRHRIQQLTDELEAAVLRLELADRRVEELGAELAARRGQEQKLRQRIRQLEAADQQPHGAELAVLEADNERLRGEHKRLRARIITLEQLLEQATARRLEAERRCRLLETALSTAEEDVAAEQWDRLRQAEKLEQQRRAEEQRLRDLVAEQQQQLADLQARSDPEDRSDKRDDRGVAGAQHHPTASASASADAARPPRPNFSGRVLDGAERRLPGSLDLIQGSGGVVLFTLWVLTMLPVPLALGWLGGVHGVFMFNGYSNGDAWIFLVSLWVSSLPIAFPFIGIYLRNPKNLEAAGAAALSLFGAIVPALALDFVIGILIAAVSGVFHVLAPGIAAHFLGLDHLSSIIRDWLVWRF